ncbi:hypothetical protein [Ferruginibacter sp. HRS2-29]|uniref:hypothetical protein n=1 Tax=Ferruginibacter sp. HRS2-29 TaxID=2487334 RepID=UPI0020CD6D96|nr:hypothetical protein [Ferruginibacter sp. HRS2-29]MCP9750320.1 hypothetical protein [Ferruginibacter sp. HRS2-29]
MKLFLLLSLVTGSLAAAAQPKLISQATVTTTTTVIAPEEDELQNVQNQGAGGPGQMFRNFGDGETKSTTYLKNDLVKTIIKTDMGRSTIIRNNNTKVTTTLLEMMGRKTGFYVSDEEQAQMRKRMDSMMQNRKVDSGATVRTRPASSENKIEVHTTDETKKIAGYTCKKAYVVTTRILGIKDSNAIWYTPEIKLQNLHSTGGTMGFGGFGSTNGFDKVDGFVMAYEAKMPRGRKMTVEVSKIDISKEIADKEFEIPKDFEVKPMKEMQNMFGGGQGGRVELRMGQ